jgi:hypothetical protein
MVWREKRDDMRNPISIRMLLRVKIERIPFGCICSQTASLDRKHAWNHHSINYIPYALKLSDEHK